MQPATGQTYTILHTFKGIDGARPQASLILDAKGNLYGTTEEGGTFGLGTVFRLDATGRERVLHSFSGTGGDGAYPWARVIRDSVGTLYGTTWKGGAYGYGTVFKLNKSGTETILYAFTGGADGASPFSGLVRDTAGNLYGTTSAGGDFGYGTIFKVNTGGAETVLHSFAGPRTDGQSPMADLLRDATGNLFGTTFYGGTYGPGTVFEVDTAGTETVLYSFMGSPDGGYPYAGLVLDEAGNFYGTTLWGGTSGSVCPGNSSCGTVFTLNASGTETVLYSFRGGADGGNPWGSLVQGSGASLLGTTEVGGDLECNAPYGCGTVFKVRANRKESVLHKFTGRRGDGKYAYAGLVRDKAGNLYGVTTTGGARSCSNGNPGCGVVFKLTP